MKKIFLKKACFYIGFLSLSFTLAGCESEIKKEEVVKKRDEIRENLNQAKEHIQEALSIKEKYLEQQKENMLSQLQERQFQVEMEIEKLEDMVNDSQSIADSEINAAISKYKTELKRIAEKRDDIRNAAKEDWKAKSEEFQKQIDAYKQNLEIFMGEIEELEAIKSDSI